MSQRVLRAKPTNGGWTDALDEAELTATAEALTYDNKAFWINVRAVWWVLRASCGPKY